MNGRKALWLVVLLALIGIAGIVGMLLVGGIWDSALLLLAATPLLLGGWRAWTMRSDDRSR